jgi:hypothetical protein
MRLILELHRADVDVLANVFFSMLDERNDINCYLDMIGIPPKKELWGTRLSTIRYRSAAMVQCSKGWKKPPATVCMNA